MHANNKNTNKNSLEINLNHNHKVDKIDGVIGLPTKFWLEIKERSADNTLPIAMVIFWSQFSLSYLSVLVITKGDVSFITAAFNPTLISTYAFVSSVLVIAFVASLAIKYVNKQRAEKKELNEINETAANATKIEITPDLGNKEEEISIILPISENQETILKKQMEENRNKVVLLIAPSLVVTTFLVIGALYKSGFSFANVSDWIEVAVIAITVATAIVGACILVNKLQKNGVTKVDDTLSTVKKLSNADILCPWKNDKTILVMKEYAIEPKEDDLTSKLTKLFDKHLAEFTNKTVDSLDGRLAEATRLLDEKLLEPTSAKINGTLDHLKGIREDLKSVFDMLKDILIPKIDKFSQILDKAEQLLGTMNSLDIKDAFSDLRSAIEDSKDIIETLKKDYADTMPILKNAIKDAENATAKLTDRIERFQPSWLLGTFLPSQQSNQNEHRDDDSNEDFQGARDWENEITELKKELVGSKKAHAELKKSIAKMSSNRTRPEAVSGLGSMGGLSRNRRHSTGSLGHESNSASSLEAQLRAQQDQARAQLNKEKLAKTKNELLKSRERTEGLEKENAKMEKEHSQQEEASKRQEKLNGQLRNFVLFVLGSTELKGKNSKNENVSATPRSFNNQVKISRKDGPPITCNVDKDGSLQVDETFDLKNIHAAILQQHVLCR